VLVAGATGSILLLLVSVRRRSPRFAWASATSAGFVLLGLACTPTGLEFYWIYTDPIGFPVAMTNTPATPSQAKVIWRASYEPFGLATEELDPDGDGKQVRMPMRFPGQWWDFATNLHDNFYRTYDPATGRYLEADPIGQGATPNVFIYAIANPMLYVDRDGLDVEVGVRKFYPIPVPYARHCFVRFNRSDQDTLSFDNTGVHVDPNPDGGVFTSTSGEPNDECVRNSMRACRADQYDFTNFNCCHCVSNALYSCGLENTGTWPNSPFDASLPPFVPVPKPPDPRRQLEKHAPMHPNSRQPLRTVDPH
jgi:RHS repeat-associated protein